MFLTLQFVHQCVEFSLSFLNPQAWNIRKYNYNLMWFEYLEKVNGEARKKVIRLLGNSINSLTYFNCLKILILPYCCSSSWSCSILWFLRKQIIQILLHFCKICIPTGSTHFTLITFGYKRSTHCFLFATSTTLQFLWVRPFSIVILKPLSYCQSSFSVLEKWHLAQCLPLALGALRTTKPLKGL